MCWCKFYPLPLLPTWHLKARQAITFCSQNFEFEELDLCQKDYNSSSFCSQFINLLVYEYLSYLCQTLIHPWQKHAYYQCMEIKWHILHCVKVWLMILLYRCWNDSWGVFSSIVLYQGEHEQCFVPVSAKAGSILFPSGRQNSQIYY